MENIKNFIATNQLEMTSSPAESSATMKKEMFHWLVTIKKGDRNLAVSYSTGGAHIQIKENCNLGYKAVFGERVGFNDIQKAKDDVGRCYYDFKTKEFLNFSGRTNNFDKGVRALVFEPKPPTLEDVLEALVADSSVLDYSCFDEWCTDLGYSEDSIQAFKVYNACIENAVKLRNFLGRDEETRLLSLEF